MLKNDAVFLSLSLAAMPLFALCLFKASLFWLVGSHRPEQAASNVFFSISSVDAFATMAQRLAL